MRAVWFSEEEVTRLLEPAALMERLEAAFADSAAGLLAEPRPLRIDAHEHGANYVAFPAYWPAAGIASTKVLSGVLSNPGRGVPKIDAIIIVMDAVTGRIRAIMDGRRITALRTAATTTLALSAMGMKRDGVLALIGTGVQLNAHAETLSIDTNFEAVLVASANDNPERAAQSAEKVRELTGLPAKAVSLKEAVSAADTIVLTTIAHEPVVRLGETKPNALVASVGPFHPSGSEIDLALVRAASAVVSDRAARLKDEWTDHRGEFGRHYDGMLDLAAVLADRSLVPDHGVRVFLSEGRSVEDLAAASLVLEAAERQGVAVTPLP